MEEKQKKSAEEKMESRFGNRLIETIIGKTYSRHSKLDEKEYIKAIGFEGKVDSEEVAVRQAIFNLLVATTKQLFMIKTATNLIKSSLDILEEDKKDE